MSESLKRNYYIAGREWPYKNVPRRIIAEKYMEDVSGGKKTIHQGINLSNLKLVESGKTAEKKADKKAKKGAK